MGGRVPPGVPRHSGVVSRDYEVVRMVLCHYPRTLPGGTRGRVVRIRATVHGRQSRLGGSRPGTSMASHGSVWSVDSFFTLVVVCANGSGT